MELGFEGLEKLKKNYNPNEVSKSDQTFYGHGKLLLSGEYFLLDGAKGLALPTTLGQRLTVKYTPSFNPKMTWKSYDHQGNLWFHSDFEFWHFECSDPNPSDEALFLQKILRQARKQNKHFLRDGVDVHVETHLDFPLDWGLGSSSTLIYNIAQWAYISPFELLFNTYGGSGYDIACAQSEGPIIYVKNNTGPYWAPTHFSPEFKDNLYFLYLGNKKDSREAITDYKTKRPFPPELIYNLSEITNNILNAKTLEEFEFLLEAHERMVGENLNMTPVKADLFDNYWGMVKSLGAWGGDFVMVTSNRSKEETKQYFEDKGYSVFLGFEELILKPQFENIGITEGENEYLH